MLHNNCRHQIHITSLLNSYQISSNILNFMESEISNLILSVCTALSLGIYQTKYPLVEEVTLDIYRNTNTTGRSSWPVINRMHKTEHRQRVLKHRTTRPTYRGIVPYQEKPTVYSGIEPGTSSSISININIVSFSQNAKRLNLIEIMLNSIFVVLKLQVIRMAYLRFMESIR